MKIVDHKIILLVAVVFQYATHITRRFLKRAWLEHLSQVGSDKVSVFKYRSDKVSVFKDRSDKVSVFKYRSDKVSVVKDRSDKVSVFKDRSKHSICVQE